MSNFKNNQKDSPYGRLLLKWLDEAIATEDKESADAFLIHASEVLMQDVAPLEGGS